jgi:hypothetical protein
LLPHADPSADPSGTIKLSVRLCATDSAALATQAAALGCVARLVALLIRRASSRYLPPSAA